MKLNELIDMYKVMRTALLFTVPVAIWGVSYWLTGGEMLVSFLFGIWTVVPISEHLPSDAEVRRRLKTRESTGHIWYMVEDYDGSVRTYK